MFTIHSIMLVSLGFLFAALLGFIIAPAYWARAVRLTTDRLRRSMPMTEAEIRAERDKLRAENAVRVHHLESQTERARLSAARQRVEINRRDGRISTLERQVREFQTNLEASDNARRVLEQTIVDRVPKIEARLIETRKLLDARDAEIDRIKSGASKTFQALDEAMQINAQQRGEIDRLRSSLATRTGTDSAASPRYDTEIALRSELEELRARTRDQASLISKLQDMARLREQEPAKPEASSTADGPEEKPGSVSAKILHLNAAKTGGDAEDVPSPSPQELTQEALQAEVETLKAANRAQALEIDKLKAALQNYESEAESGGERKPWLGVPLQDGKSPRQSKQLAAAAETTRQEDEIKRLRAELAAANDRLARQATQFREELRRLGSGTVQATTRGRRAGYTSILTDEPALTQTPPAEADEPTGSGRPSLTRRITEEFPETAAAFAGSEAERSPSPPRSGTNGTGQPVQNADVRSDAEAAPDAGQVSPGEPPGKPKPVEVQPEEPVMAEQVSAAGPSDTTENAPPPRRRSLMDRIARLSKG